MDTSLVRSVLLTALRVMAEPFMMTEAYNNDTRHI